MTAMTTQYSIQRTNNRIAGIFAAPDGRKVPFEAYNDGALSYVDFRVEGRAFDRVHLGQVVGTAAPVLGRQASKALMFAVVDALCSRAA